MNQDRVDSLAEFHPFSRLNRLLAGIEPQGGNQGPNTPLQFSREPCTPLLLSVGEPQFQPPAFVAETVAASSREWGRYPPTAGTEAFRDVVKIWLDRRYGLESGFLMPDRMILPVAGTREALFHIALSAVSAGLPKGKNRVLMGNPFYHTYAGAAVVAGGSPAFLPAGRANGFLPDPNQVPQALLKSACLVYLCSPSNPQGAVAGLDYWRCWLDLARRYDFLIAADECYAEIYRDRPPSGALQAAQATGSVDHLVIFHSLSKRSSAPGLRAGFIAGDPAFLARQVQLINYGGAAVPLPILAAATRLWADEAHVEENRRRYRQNFDFAQKALGPLFGEVRPDGGFFLWLEVGDGERIAVELWRKTAIKVLPGAYMARVDEQGRNPGAGFIRVALVHEPDMMEGALVRMAKVLTDLRGASPESHAEAELVRAGSGRIGTDRTGTGRTGTGRTGTGRTGTGQ